MSVSPLGIPQQRQESEVTSTIELNDADIFPIEKVLQVLNARGTGQRRDLEAFRIEILERFGAIGFKVDVKVYEAETYGDQVVYVYKIEIRDRYEGEFDPDQMVAETTADILDLGTKGVINTSGLWTPPGSQPAG